METLPAGVKRASIALWAYAALGVLIGLLSLFLVAFSAVAAADGSLPQEEAITNLVTFVCLAGWVGIFAVASALSGVGLRRGSKVAWFVAAILGALLVINCCTLPFGAAILWGVIDEETRQHCGV